MEEPRFLTNEELLALHAESLLKWTGQDGIRDQGLFESAADAPKNIWHYREADDPDLVFQIAATYAFSLAENQAFLDGNKRTAAAASLLFLAYYGLELPSSADLRIHKVLIQLAKREAKREDIAVLLKTLVEETFEIPT